jgi:hypothetical protein
MNQSINYSIVMRALGDFAAKFYALHISFADEHCTIGLLASARVLSEFMPSVKDWLSSARRRGRMQARNPLGLINLLG